MSADNRLEQAMANIDAGNGEGLGLLDMLASASKDMTADEMAQFKETVWGDAELSGRLAGFLNSDQ